MFTLYTLSLHLPDYSAKQTGGGALADPVAFQSQSMLCASFFFLFVCFQYRQMLSNYENMQGVNRGKVFRKTKVHQLSAAADDAGGGTGNILTRDWTTFKNMLIRQEIIKSNHYSNATHH